MLSRIATATAAPSAGETGDARIAALSYRGLKRCAADIGRRLRITDRYRFEDRSTGSKTVVCVLSGHKTELMPFVLPTLAAAARHHYVCVVSPGLYDEALGSGGPFQVKKLHVKPGAKLSMQMHYHRSEHWIVVKGTANVVIGDVEKLVRENESVYIFATQRHRLENPGKVPLEIIEVQIGTYLGEDDIIRSDDIYKRAPEETK